MPAVLSSAYVAPFLLLFASNVFMTIAWYGHLRFQGGAAGDGDLRHLGHRVRRVLPRRAGQSHRQRRLSAAQLKTMQEVITLLVSRLLGALSQGTDHLELRDRVCADRHQFISSCSAGRVLVYREAAYR